MQCPLAPPSPVYRARGSSEQSFLLALPGGILTGSGHQVPCPGTAGALGGLVGRMLGCFALELGGLRRMTATSRHSRRACSHHVSLGGRRWLSITCRGSWPMRGGRGGVVPCSLRGNVCDVPTGPTQSWLFEGGSSVSTGGSFKLNGLSQPADCVFFCLIEK